VALDLLTQALLAVIALISGIGITTIGPGGIFVTVALYTLTDISSAEVAGTAHLTFIGTGIVGSIAYLRSGELSTPEGKWLAVLLSAGSIVGAPAGAYINSYVSRRLFGVLLGTFAALIGLIIVYREHNGLQPVFELDVTSAGGRVVLILLGIFLGVTSGLLGVGGPVIAVPLLVFVGVPILLAVAVAQVQSIFIAGFATAGYVAQGNVLVPLAILVGIPLMVGVAVGWRLAHRIDPRRLKVILGIVLVGVGAHLAV
jgi:uncharacterized membrane protein YfcA